MQDERRRDVRVRVSLPVERVRRGLVERLEIIEGSYRGVLLKMPEAPRLGELLKLRVKLPDHEICLHAVPVRFTSRGGAIAVGCALFALRGSDKDDWQTHIGNLLRVRARAA